MDRPVTKCEEVKPAVYQFIDFWSGSKKQINVDIVGETNKSFKIKFKEFHPNGQKPGYETWVTKKSILWQNKITP